MNPSRSIRRRDRVLMAAVKDTNSGSFSFSKANRSASKAAA
jgi:hypothetical protein